MIVENKSLILVISGIILLYNYENERNNDFYQEFREFRK